jgi:perosamine synthetase
MRIKHSKPYLGKEELAAAGSVLMSGHLAQGETVARLESGLSALVGHAHGAAVSSGTAALFCALRGLGVGLGDEVIIPTYVCTALLNAVTMTGADVRLADVDPETGNLTPYSVDRKLTKKTIAVIVPHMFGFPADAAGIECLGVPVIEDCAQCVGERVLKRPVGGLTSVSIFSFYATKLIAGGEGGMVATSEKKIRDRVIALREYDKRDTWTPSFNFKLSELHAALALAQLKKLPEMLRLRKAVADAYRAALAGRAGALCLPPEDQDVFYRFVVRVPRAIGKVIKAMREKGIECGSPVYKPLHRYLKQPGFPGAERIHNTAISLPFHPALSEKEIAFVVKELLKLLESV